MDRGWAAGQYIYPSGGGPPPPAEGPGLPSLDSDGSELFPGAGTPLPGPTGDSEHHVTGRMNKTERRYAEEVLGPRMAAGEVIWWRFESVNFRIGHNCYYRADFLVQLADRSMEIHETKGHMRDDARVKISVMKEMYPYRVWLCRWVKPDRKAGTPARWDVVPA